MFRFAHRQTGMDWFDIWEKLTGESPRVHAINTNNLDSSTPIDFFELFDPGNFTAQK